MAAQTPSPDAGKEDPIYQCHQVVGLRPGIFGESWIIIAVTDCGDKSYLIERITLTQRPSEKLVTHGFKLSVDNVPEELGVINTDYLLTEIRERAELDFYQLLEKRAQELGVNVYDYSFELQMRPNPFVGFATRFVFNDKLKDIAEFTRCPPLKRHLDLLSQVSISWTDPHEPPA